MMKFMDSNKSFLRKNANLLVFFLSPVVFKSTPLTRENKQIKQIFNIVRKLIFRDFICITATDDTSQINTFALNIQILRK